MKKSILNTIILSSLSFGMFAQTLVQDINPGTPNSSVDNLTVFGNDLYFTAYDITNAIGLWKYDGTTTSVIVDNNITFTYYPEQLTVAGNYLYFVAHDGTHGWEVWKTDGTNIAMLQEIRPGNNTTKPSQLFAFNNELYFQANDGTNGTELWKTDGTTNTLIDINPGAGTSSPQRFAVFNNTLHFVANDGTHGIELWKYDGTNATLVADIITGSIGSNPYELTVFDNKLVFGAIDSINGGELFEFDGTNVTMIQDLNPGSGNSYPNELTVMGNNLFFNAIYASGNKLMKYDGSNIVEVPIGTGAANPDPYNFTPIGGELFFTANDGVHGYELWKYDGNIATMVQDISPGIDNSEIAQITQLGNLVYFYYEYNVGQLWKYDGSVATVVPVGTTTDSEPWSLTVMGNSLFFSAFTPEFGEELWKIQGSFADVENIVSNQDIQLYPNPSSHVITLQGLTNEAPYQIINVLGEVVLQGTASNGQSINVESLTKGLYFVKLNNSSAIRFIKE